MMTHRPLARLIFAIGVLALGSGSAAMAQQAVIGGTTTSHTGIAEPPPGATPESPKKLDHSNASVQGNNTPTLPQVALHPEATIGSPVPIAGPGGTAKTPTGD